jgi:hypothetical protein
MVNSVKYSLQRLSKQGHTAGELEQIHSRVFDEKYRESLDQVEDRKEW